MKTTYMDFVLSGSVLSLILIGALAATAYLVVPLSVRATGDYHVIVDSFAFLLAFGLLCALAVRAAHAIKALRPGEYSMGDSVFAMWKLQTVIYELGRGALLPFTTVFSQPLVASLFGVRVGAHTALGGRIADPSLIAVEDGAVLGHNSLVSGHVITEGQIILGRVRIGRGATVGANAVVLPGVEVGEGSIIAIGALVVPNTKIPAGEVWGGNPARKRKNIEASDARA